MAGRFEGLTDLQWGFLSSFFPPTAKEAWERFSPSRPSQSTEFYSVHSDYRMSLV